MECNFVETEEQFVQKSGVKKVSPLRYFVEETPLSEKIFQRWSGKGVICNRRGEMRIEIRGMQLQCANRIVITPP